MHCLLSWPISCVYISYVKDCSLLENSLLWALSMGNLFDTVIFYDLIGIRMYSIVHSLLYLFRHQNWIRSKNSCKTTTYKVLISKNVLRKLKKFIRVDFSSSNIVEIWAHWMCMAVERQYEYHLYPIRGFNLNWTALLL